MEKDKIISIVQDFVKKAMQNEQSGHDWWHIKRVCNIAKKINKREQKDEFKILMIALLHDIYDNKIFEGNSKNALIKLFKDLKINDSIEEKEIESIIHDILHIGFKGGFNLIELSPEGQIVQDADRIDGMGAIGIARTFTYGGRIGRIIYNPDVGIIKINSEDEYRNLERHTINHFYEKLLNLKDTMNTTEGRCIAMQRHKYMEDFLREFFEEWGEI